MVARHEGVGDMSDTHCGPSQRATLALVCAYLGATLRPHTSVGQLSSTMAPYWMRLETWNRECMRAAAPCARAF